MVIHGLFFPDHHSSFEAIYYGHVAVVDDQVVGSMEGCVYGILPIRRDIHPQTETLQHATDHLLIHAIIFCHKDMARKLRSDDLVLFITTSRLRQQAIICAHRVVSRSPSYKMGEHIAASCCFSKGMINQKVEPIPGVL